MFFFDQDMIYLLFKEIINSERSVVLIKDSNFEQLKDIVQQFVKVTGREKCFYKEKDEEKNYEPFFPFFSLIKDEVNKRCIDVDTFLNELNVNLSHGELIKNYVKEGVAYRNESIILFDYKYEFNKLYEEIISILNELSRKEQIYIIIEDINKLKSSTLNWLHWIIKKNKKLNFKIILTTTTYTYFSEVLQEKFDDLINVIESNGIIFDSYDVKIKSKRSTRLSLEMGEKAQNKMLVNAQNAYLFLQIDDAFEYYMKIYKNIKSRKYRKYRECNKDLEIVFRRLGNIYLMKQDYKNAYVYYNHLYNIGVEMDDPKLLCIAQQKKSLVDISRNNLTSAEKLAQQSYKLSLNINNDFLKFKSFELFFWIKQKGGTIKLIKKDELNLNFINFCKKYNQQNRLAYFLTHNYNDIPSRSAGFYYKEGLEIARDIKNENCVLSSYLNKALLYAKLGHDDISIKYYEKVENMLIELKDYFKLGQIYNGMGYYFLMRGDYNKANDYYNKSLENLKGNWNFDEICTTLVNLSINNFLTKNYLLAKEQLKVLVFVMKKLNLSRLRLVSDSKIYGLIALNNFYLGNTYNAYTFLLKMETSNLKANSYEKDEENFLKNFIKGLTLKKRNNLKETIELFKCAQKSIKNIKGSLLCLYPVFLYEYYLVLKESNLITFAEEIEKEAKDYCDENLIISYQSFFKQEFNKGIIVKNNISEIKWIKEAAKQKASVLLLNSRIEEINFINKFQEILGNYNDKHQVINNAIMLLENKFSIDFSLLLCHHNKCGNVLYSTKSKNINTLEYTRLEKLSKFLERYDSCFVSNKNSNTECELNKKIYDLTGIKVQSLIYVPIIKQNQRMLSYIGITEVNEEILDENFMLNESNLEIINISIRQLTETIQRLNYQEMLLENVSKDVLTKLYNRHYFYEKVESILDNINGNSEEHISLFFIDLDNFKYYNDNFGHDVGDLILRWFADILKEICGESEIVVRYGGDEFLLFARNCCYEKSKNIATKIYTSLLKSNGFKDEISSIKMKKIDIAKKYLINCSIGVVTRKLSSSLKIKTLVDSADKAMYRAKKLGKGRFFIAGD